MSHIPAHKPALRTSAKPQQTQAHGHTPLSSAAQLIALQRTVGNRAVMRMLEAQGAINISQSQVSVQRMFDATDLKGTSTGSVIWKRYTPDKDAGANLLNHLATKCGTPNQIDTGVLAAVTGANAVVYHKIATFIAAVMNNFAGSSFPGSTLIHGNGESRYPVDEEHPERYVEFGVSGTGQTRIVFDRIDRVCYLSTHYEAPKVLLVAGAAPAAAMDHMEDVTQNWGYEPIA